MKDLFVSKVWPVVAGLLVAFAIMMALEYLNSFIYPLPDGLDITDPEAVRAFTATLPWTAYILVFVGWVGGAFCAGAVTTYLSGEATYRLSLAVAIILTLGGLINNIMIGHDIFFNIVGLPMFLIFTYLGHRYQRKSERREEHASVA